MSLEPPDQRKRARSLVFLSKLRGGQVGEERANVLGQRMIDPEPVGHQPIHAPSSKLPDNQETNGQHSVVFAQLTQ
jgi:hypothetical protein